MFSKRYAAYAGLILALLFSIISNSFAAQVSGDLIKWHAVTLDFDGPFANEMHSSPNPFLDYRLQVTFTGPSNQSYKIPGYFAGNGQGGGSGSVWRVKFAPDEAGTWSYSASFRAGNNVAISLNDFAGNATSFNGESGHFDVAPRDNNAPLFYRDGRLESINDFYFKFRDGGYWIKGGMNSPEGILGYHGFDNTPVGPHDFASHRQDWNTGDPDWNSPDTSATQDGRGIIGMINYLAEQNLNSIYFLPMNIGTDDNAGVWPYASTNINPNGSSFNDNVHFDISKLEQWLTFFEHAQSQSVFLHFVLSDTKYANKMELDNATLGTERKLYYREMVARFAHLNALQWNISEEYNLSLPLDPNVIKEFAQYINDIDAYDHAVTVHPHGNTYKQALAPFIGDPRFGAFSIQTWQLPESVGPSIEYMREESSQAGLKNPTSSDESIGIDQISAEAFRKRIMWDAFLSGGSLELYNRNQDRYLNDFRPYENHYRYMWFARKFVQENLPFWEMEPLDDLVANEVDVWGGAEVFAKEREIYAVFLPDASSANTVLLTPNLQGSVSQRWYNPRTGEFVGATQVFNGGDLIQIGLPPSDINEDWVTLIEVDGSSNPDAPVFHQDVNAPHLLSIEAENAQNSTEQSNHYWQFVNANSPSGVGAMQALPDVGWNVKDGIESLSPRLDYDVEFKTAGTHYVWVRGLGDGDSTGKNDSVHVGLNGLAETPADGLTGFNSGWTWSNTTVNGPMTLNIPYPGVHTVNLWMREDGLIVDKIVLSSDASLNPSSFGTEGPAQSPVGPVGEPTLAAPEITPAPGSYLGPIEVSINPPSAEAQLFYTMDGSDPDLNSTPYTGPFVVDQSTSVKAIATHIEWNDSAIVSADYTISYELDSPSIEPAGGNYFNSVEVSLSTSTPGGSIYYSLDGSVPTPTSGNLYSGPFTILSDSIVTAITAVDGFPNSSAVFETYSISIAQGPVVFQQDSTGILSIEAENFDDREDRNGFSWTDISQNEQSGSGALQALPNIGYNFDSSFENSSPQLSYQVEFKQSGQHYVWVRGLGDSDSNGKNDSMHVGLDGNPISSADRITGFNGEWTWSNSTMDGNPAVIDVDAAGEHTLNIWMREDGLIVDKIVIASDATFNPESFGNTGPLESSKGPVGVPTLAAPQINPAPGSYLGSIEISMNASVGSNVYYTDDGTPPSESANLYTAPFMLSNSATIKALAVSDGFSDSPVTNAEYNIINELSSPSISPAGGTYVNSVSVTLTTDIEGASIHYTLDGSTPGTDSPQYQAPLVITENTPVTAITALNGFADSAQTSETYTIEIGPGDGPFKQAANGLISIEAEHTQNNLPRGNHEWTEVTQAGSSSSAMQVLPDIGWNFKTGFSSYAPQMDYEIEFTQSGTHYVWLRGLGDSDSAGKNDSAHVGLDGNETPSSSGMTGFNSSWTWSNNLMSGARSTLEIPSPGIYTVNLWMREDGLIIDKIVITTDAALSPNSFGPQGPAESPRQ